MNPKRLFACLLFLALAISPALSAVVYQVKVTNHDGSQGPESIEMAALGHKLKMGVAMAGPNTQGDVIFDGDRKEMVVIDHDSQGYYVIDKATMGQISTQVNAAMAQMEEALKNVPEDQREMMKQMMEKNMPGVGTKAKKPANELKKTGEKATKNGYPCVKYEVWRDGAKTQELWVTNWSNVKGADEMVETFETMASFFNEFMEALPNMADGPADDNVFAHMNELNGFPVVTRAFEGGELQSETVLESVTERDMDPDAFEPPSGYKRQTMGMP
ncbi:MAG: hypothetical protein OEV00_07800 [Acidobacteriota bacterium]|nr:hypothetical protein [Acidobacteriota bacterium]